MKILQVMYNRFGIFKIPKNINLKDKNQVKDYWVKYSVLYIKLVSDEILEIEVSYYEDADDIGCIITEDEYYSDSENE